MSRDEMQADLAYLREMAEVGGEAPPISGRFASWWGGLTVLALCAQWSVLSGHAPFGYEALLPLWLAYSVLGVVGSVILGRTICGVAGGGAAGNRMAVAVWSAVGAALICYFAAILAGVSIGRLQPSAFNSILPVALLTYAIGWLSSAVMTRKVWLVLPASTAMAGMVACLLFLNDPLMYLIGALSVAGSALAPGLVLMANERSDHA